MFFAGLRPYKFNLCDLYKFLAMAIPVTISNGTEAIMMFVDRLFLSHYAKNAGEAYLNAALIGALTSFLLTSFFSVTAGYSNALVSQYCGARQKQLCARVISQTIFFALTVYPLILIGILFLPVGFAVFNHSQFQTELETIYTQILLGGSFLIILRSSFGGFFIGIGRPKIIMAANVTGMLINIPLNYVLIFGFGAIPSYGIIGAAVATLISSALSLAILLLVYYGPEIHKEYRTRRKLIFDSAIMKKLLEYGAPAGFDAVLGMLVFDFFIIVMSSYGETVGAAVTIAINWDLMFYLPMMGTGFATTALVGRNMGAENIFEAKRTVFLSCTVTSVYSFLISSIMLLFADPLVAMFLSDMKNAAEVQPLAIVMLRFSALYLIADAFSLSLAGALRGAGDTKAVMVIITFLHIIFGIIIYFAVFNKFLTPLQSWYVLVGFVFSIALGMALRFWQGKWQKIRLVDSSAAFE